MRKCIIRRRSKKSRWRSNKNSSKFLILPLLLTNFEIQNYYQSEPKFNGVYSRNNLSKIKDEAIIITIIIIIIIINLDEYESIGTHWIAVYGNVENLTYFDSYGVEYIPKEIIKLIGNKNIIANIYRIQRYDSIMCGYFSNWFILFYDTFFIDYMIKGKRLLGYTNSFSPSKYKANDKIVLKYFNRI